MHKFSREDIFVSDLLLITDMARLSRSFERLADDSKFTLRVVTNLERGGEEIAIKKPDVVFVQTHLSGLSADILQMHLKKQLARKRTRFVLLATPAQVNSDILKPYQGWLDISCEESQLAEAIQNLLTSLFSKSKKPDPRIQAKEKKVAETVSEEPLSAAVTPVLLTRDFGVTAEAVLPAADNVSPPMPLSVKPEASLEDQGLTYSPHRRLSVYSEFNSSFDSAVNRIEDPESLKESAPLSGHNWNTALSDNIETVSSRSKRSTFLLWLAPVVVTVVIVTFLQMNRSVPTPVTVVAAPVVSPPVPVTTATQPVPEAVKPAEKPNPPAPVAVKPAEQSKPAVQSVAKPVEQPRPPVSVKPPQDSESIDKAVISAVKEIRESKPTTTSSKAKRRITTLPDFIPRYGYDKNYGKSNPGWERYKGQVTEFKIFREGETIKAIQVVDRGGKGVPESFMKGVLRQVAKKSAPAVEESEKKDGYEIQRGSVSDNLKVVYYRDEQGGRLRAFVMTWE